jgi:hypothetical protein
MDIHTAEPLVPERRLVEVEITMIASWAELMQNGNQERTFSEPVDEPLFSKI